jgi:hypothetical protein
VLSSFGLQTAWMESFPLEISQPFERGWVARTHSLFVNFRSGFLYCHPDRSPLKYTRASGS